MLPVSDAVASLMKFARKGQGSHICSLKLVPERPAASAAVSMSAGGAILLTAGHHLRIQQGGP